MPSNNSLSSSTNNYNFIYSESDDSKIEPSTEDIHEFARRIGIDPDKEPHLLDLAKEGLLEKLPPNWRPCFDRHKQAWYYHNVETLTSQWEHPLDALYRQKVAQAKADTTMNKTVRFTSSTMNGSFDPLSNLPNPAGRHPKSLPPLKAKSAGVGASGFLPLSNTTLTQSQNEPTRLVGSLGKSSILKNAVPTSSSSPQLQPRERPSTASIARSNAHDPQINGEAQQPLGNRKSSTLQLQSLTKKPSGLTLTGSGANFLKSSMTKSNDDDQSRTMIPKHETVVEKAASNGIGIGIPEQLIKLSMMLKTSEDDSSSEMSLKEPVLRQPSPVVVNRTSSSSTSSDSSQSERSSQSSISKIVRHKPLAEEPLAKNMLAQSQRISESADRLVLSTPNVITSSVTSNNGASISVRSGPGQILKDVENDLKKIDRDALYQQKKEVLLKEVEKEVQVEVKRLKESMREDQMKQVQQMKDYHESYLNRLKKEMNEQIENELKKIDKNALTQQKKQELLKDIEKEVQAEIEKLKNSLRDEQKKQLQQMKDDHQNNLSKLKQGFSQEIEQELGNINKNVLYQQKKDEILKEIEDDLKKIDRNALFQKRKEELLKEIEIDLKKIDRNTLYQQMKEEILKEMEKEVQAEAKTMKDSIREEQKTQIQQMKDYHESYVKKLRKEFDEEIEDLKKHYSDTISDSEKAFEKDIAKRKQQQISQRNEENGGDNNRNGRNDIQSRLVVESAKDFIKAQKQQRLHLNSLPGAYSPLKSYFPTSSPSSFLRLRKIDDNLNITTGNTNFHLSETSDSGIGTYNSSYNSSPNTLKIPKLDKPSKTEKISKDIDEILATLKALDMQVKLMRDVVTLPVQKQSSSSLISNLSNYDFQHTPTLLTPLVHPISVPSLEHLNVMIGNALSSTSSLGSNGYWDEPSLKYKELSSAFGQSSTNLKNDPFSSLETNLKAVRSALNPQRHSTHDLMQMSSTNITNSTMTTSANNNLPLPGTVQTSVVNTNSDFQIPPSLVEKTKDLREWLKNF